MERETGIEPATNSLEGCDSTTELLPPTRLAAAPDSALRRGRPAYAAPTATPASPLRRGRPGYAPANTRLACVRAPARTSAGQARLLLLLDSPFKEPCDHASPRSASLCPAGAPRGGWLIQRRLACPAAPGLSSRSSPEGRAKADGEGRIRTFEARRRQIYSLLRLTASLPRRRLSRFPGMPTSPRDG